MGDQTKMNVALTPWVLVATMNTDDVRGLLDRMGVDGPAIVVNQATDAGFSGVEVCEEGLIASTRRETGLSKSRNAALGLADAVAAEYCLVADDDLAYVPGYGAKVADAWCRRPHADILAFTVLNPDGSERVGPRRGRVGRFQTLKLRSVELSFRRSSVARVGLRFDERFGAGAPWFVGEESIFLAQAIRRGLHVERVPVVIAQLKDRPSTWFVGFDDRFFRVQGRVYRELAACVWPALCLRWVWRNRTRIAPYSRVRAVLQMARGAFGWVGECGET